MPKPTKVNGTRWIEHKYKAMEIFLQNYGAFMSHLESLAQTDSQALKGAELEGFAAKWKHASYVVHIAIYLNVLSPIKRLSLAFQEELHDPVKAVRRIRDFSWNMAKLQLLIDESLESEGSKMTNYKKLLSNVETKDLNGKTKYFYQGIKLSKYNSTIKAVPKHYFDTIIKISGSMENCFDDLSISPLFKHMLCLLDTSSWPKEEQLISEFGGKEIAEICSYFEPLLKENGCHVDQVENEWDMLKLFVVPIVKNNPSLKYFDFWQRVFTNRDINNECGNVLHIIEILLITPITNAKLERMFSRLARVKTDWRNRLGRDRLDTLLRIGLLVCPQF